jgi:hypothetical protein
LKLFSDLPWLIIEATFASLKRRIVYRCCSVWLVAVLTFYLCGVVTRFALPIILCQKPLQRFVVYPKKLLRCFAARFPMCGFSSIRRLAPDTNSL